MTWDEFSRLNLKSSIKEESLPNEKDDANVEVVTDNNNHSRAPSKSETAIIPEKASKVHVVEYTFDSDEESESESETEIEQKPSDQLVDVSEIETCARVLHLWGYIVRFEGCQESDYSVTW